MDKSAATKRRKVNRVRVLECKSIPEPNSMSGLNNIAYEYHLYHGRGSRSERLTKDLEAQGEPHGLEH